MTFMDEYFGGLPESVVKIAPNIAFNWICDPNSDTHPHDPGQPHKISCLWVWHDCQMILGANTVMPGAVYGWRASGVAAHTLVQQKPLTIIASVYWPECCGLHGFITDGKWVQV